MMQSIAGSSAANQRGGMAIPGVTAQHGARIRRQRLSESMTWKTIFGAAARKSARTVGTRRHSTSHRRHNCAEPVYVPTFALDQVLFQSLCSIPGLFGGPRCPETLG